MSRDYPEIPIEDASFWREKYNNCKEYLGSNVKKTFDQDDCFLEVLQKKLNLIYDLERNETVLIKGIVETLRKESRSYDLLLVFYLGDVEVDCHELTIEIFKNEIFNA